MVRRAFLITPLSAKTAGNEDPATYDAVQAALKSASDENDLELLRADDIFRSGVVIEQIRGEIEQAELIIAVCTGRNANVFYELGLAEAGRKPQILVAAASSDLPFDIGHLRAQLYGDGSPGPATLRERVSKAIRETLAETPRVAFQEPAPSTDPPSKPAPASDNDPLQLVRQRDDVGYIEGARNLISEAQKRHKEAAKSNTGVTPSPDVLASLADLRDSSAEAIVSWLEPAIEYAPDYLERPLRELSEAFGESLLESGGHGSFWTSMHQAWISLALKGSLAIALMRERPQAVQLLLRLRPPSTLADRDEAPLMLNPSFTWNAGYLGDSRVAFEDFARYASVSEALGEHASGDESLNLVCGTDLAIGLARWILEENPGDLSLSGFRRPYTYSGFAAYYCDRISRTARLLESSEDLAAALGADSLSDFRRQAREAFRPLSENIEPGRGWTSCDSWEEALEARG